MDKKIIKEHLTKTFLVEENTPGISVTDKAKKESDADKKDAEQKAYYQEKFKNAYVSLITGPFSAFGAALVQQQDGWAALGKAALQAISTIINKAEQILNT
jgi:hypothetical protein